MAATCLRAFARLVLMSTNRPRRPGAPNQGPWEAMARELSSDPDSPASLRIMSAVNSALRPRAQAVDQLVDALADQEQQPGASADAAVAAARAHWRAAGCRMRRQICNRFVSKHASEWTGASDSRRHWKVSSRAFATSLTRATRSV
jgi:hypothetical protein